MISQMVGVPMRLRMLAGAVDTLLVLVGVGGPLGGWMWWMSRRTPEPTRAWEARQQQRVMRWVTPLAWLLPLAALPLRNTPTPGQRLLHIRTVDARTGGPVSLRRALAGQAMQAGYARLMRFLLSPVRRPMMDDQAEIRRRVEAFRATYPDADWNDPDLAQMAREARAGCAPLAATFAATSSLLALSARLSPRRQTFTDRLAGVVVIRERR